MIACPPIRLVVRSLPLLAALLCGGCGSVPPSPVVPSSTASTPATPTASVPTSASAPVGPPGFSPPASLGAGAVPFAGLAMLVGPDLVVVGADGVARTVASPAATIEAATVSATGIVVRTPGPVFQVATTDDIEPGLEGVRWKPIDLDLAVALRPLSAAALSPRGDRVAILAANVGGGEPFQVVIVDVAAGPPMVHDVDREVNGPPIWLDDTTVLLEVASTSRGGPFVTLDADSGAVAATNAVGTAPAVSGDRATVAVLGLEPGPSVALFPTNQWLAGADTDAAEQVALPFVAAGVAGIALDASGQRLAVGVANEDGDPVAVEAYGRGPAGWVSIGAIRSAVPRWFGWIR